VGAKIEPPLFAGKHSGGSDRYPASAGHDVFTSSLHRNKDQVLDGITAKNICVINGLSDNDAKRAGQAEKIRRSGAAEPSGLVTERTSF
jgi:hypothetical protein